MTLQNLHNPNPISHILIQEIFQAMIVSPLSQNTLFVTGKDVINTVLTSFRTHSNIEYEQKTVKLVISNPPLL